MSEVLQVWLAISCRDTMRGQKKVNSPVSALKELFHFIYTLLSNYSCSLTQEVCCCCMLSDALVHLDFEVL